MLDPNTRNKDTKAIITGGAQGIGFAIARQLAAEGCKSIVLAGRTPEKGAKAVDQLKALGADALFVQADVSKVEDCRRIVASALDRFGTINGLVNTGGAHLLDHAIALFVLGLSSGTWPPPTPTA